MRAETYTSDDWSEDVDLLRGLFRTAASVRGALTVIVRRHAGTADIGSAEP